MVTFIEFIKSDIGVSIAWICTVTSTIYALVMARKNKQLKVKIGKYENSINIDGSQDIVTQNGDKSVYTKNNSGGMNIKM